MINYIGYYGNNHCREKRSYVLSATNKMDYIVQALIQCGENVEITSMSPSIEQYSRGYTYTDNGAKIHMLASLKPSSTINRFINRFFMRMQLMGRLLMMKRCDTVLVYHSLGYMNAVNLIHKLKKFYLVLEVEEIYSDVIGNAKLRSKEIRFTQSADSYIIPTRLLSEIVNLNRKPEAVIHGTYAVEPDRGCNDFEQDLHDDSERIVHCVYAGTMDPRKGGAVAAAAAAEFLPSHYHIHILGFGSEKQIQEMKDRIVDISSRSKAKVTYDGLLSAEEYIRFIQSCDIGLSTQNPNAGFNATSFPSKILSYLANGLRVVSIRIPAIEQSAVGDTLYYYDTQTPEEIAKAILSVDMNSAYDSRAQIQELDNQFRAQLGGLVK